MRALTRLFGRSPFAPLQLHMEKVVKCVHKVPELFVALDKGDPAAVEQLAADISKLEHEADLTKNDIRTGLKSHLFLPVDRASLLEALGLQDDIADKTEDIGVLLTFKVLVMPESLRKAFEAFLEKNMECFAGVTRVVEEINDLLESSFAGQEVKRMRALVDNVAYTEHEADVIQRTLLRELYALEDKLTYTAFHLWLQVVQAVGDIANLSEKLANRILMAMELK